MTTPDAPRTPLCDFCGGTDPVCYFPCRPFKLVPSHPALQPLHSGDRFYACATCRPLVEASDWEGLRRHCAQADVVQALQPQAVAALWGGFAEHRQDPAVDIAPGSDPEEDRAPAPGADTGAVADVVAELDGDPAIRAAVAAWDQVCQAAAAVVATCTDNEEGPAADPAKIPDALADATDAIQALRAAVTREGGMSLPEVDVAARRVSAALPFRLPDTVQALLGVGGTPELALTGAVMMLNVALHDAEAAIEQLL